MATSIEIAVTCTWFQHRLCWMMSSVLQQVGNVPDLTFCVGYPQYNGEPTTESVMTFFSSQGLRVRSINYPDMETIQYRGLVRNEQLKQSDAEWLLFADTDMTYHPNFFAELGAMLEGDLKDEKGIISASRVSLHKQFCKDYFRKWDKHQYPCVVEGAGELNDWPVYQISGNVGAGYFHLVNRKHILDTYGFYVNPNSCRDRSWKDGQKARSDQQFRRMVGRLKKIKLNSPQYHLNHSRDNEEGYHVTEQR